MAGGVECTCTAFGEPEPGAAPKSLLRDVPRIRVPIDGAPVVLTRPRFIEAWAREPSEALANGLATSPWGGVLLMLLPGLFDRLDIGSLAFEDGIVIGVEWCRWGCVRAALGSVGDEPVDAFDLLEGRGGANGSFVGIGASFAV